MRPVLSIIIPVYNEEEIVAQSLPPIFNLKMIKQIIIVNDGSTDKTLKIIKDLKSQYNFTLINQDLNRGKGAAVKRGLEEIRGDYFIIYDADSEYNASDIAMMFDYIIQEKEKQLAENNISKKFVLYGSRFLEKSELSFHYIVNTFLTKLTNFLFSSKLTDMETCLKMIPSSALNEIKLNGEGFEIEPIITAQLLKNNYVIKEVPVSYNRRSYQDGKKIKAKDGFIAVFTLFKEKFN
ncbi:glycosyltransferase family 2 protein [Candidatus Falkowbacteria bacterium]|nr:glycosyltransferase family 2 protein [Candidatus Falkowbacteria bacterium]NCT55155.1 glycosyltransferase family 2 protein [Candidatus Falkowbacteria bacterium]